MFRAKAHSFGRGLAASGVARALAISLLMHIFVMGGAEAGRRMGFWKHSLLPQFGQSRLQEEIAKAQKQAQERLVQPAPEAQLVFVEVDPAQVALEPPKDAKYYSSQSTLASNPDTAEEEKAKIDGQQEKVVKTFDTLKPDPRLLQPKPAPKIAVSKTPAKAQPQPEKPRPKEIQRPQLPEEPTPTRPQAPGETLLARAAPRPQPPAEQPAPRPRTVAEARAQKGLIQGPRSRQEGGARRASLQTSLDVRATPFGAYDAAFIMAVQARWFGLLDEKEFVGGQTGKVVVEFRLNSDGRISALRVVESEVSELFSWLCQRAVLDPAPYRAFPSDLRRLLNTDYREIRFTFYYN